MEELTKEQVLEKRIKILDEEDKLWKENCMSCTKIQEGVKQGIIPKGMTKDRKNPICDACPAQKMFNKIGKELDELLTAEKILRAKERM